MAQGAGNSGAVLPKDVAHMHKTKKLERRTVAGAGAGSRSDPLTTIKQLLQPASYRGSTSNPLHLTDHQLSHLQLIVNQVAVQFI